MDYVDFFLPISYWRYFKHIQSVGPDLTEEVENLYEWHFK